MTEPNKDKPKVNAAVTKPGRMPPDTEGEVSVGADKGAEEAAARDVQRAFEQGITRLPPG